MELNDVSNEKSIQINNLRKELPFIPYKKRSFSMIHQEEASDANSVSNETNESSSSTSPLSIVSSKQVKLNKDKSKEKIPKKPTQPNQPKKSKYLYIFKICKFIFKVIIKLS